MKQIPLQVDDDWGSPHDFGFTVVSHIFTSSDLMVTVSRIYGSSDVVAGSLVQPVPTVLQARFRAWSMSLCDDIMMIFPIVGWCLGHSAAALPTPVLRFSMSNLRGPWLTQGARGVRYGFWIDVPWFRSDFSDFQHFPTLFGKQLLRDVGLTWFDGLTQKQATSSSSSHQMVYQSFIHVDHFPNRIAMNNGVQ